MEGKAYSIRFGDTSPRLPPATTTDKKQYECGFFLQKCLVEPDRLVSSKEQEILDQEQWEKTTFPFFEKQLSELIQSYYGEKKN